ncbi:AAA family ATPase [Myceligenerans crystallogenes]|uniref:Nephrocystin 3-like N-terminal domain-containing protein n=1 Tax=Myceligenerans crystallogenes TaxID=316335 RepID=A0ABN2NM82_9MICO
MVAGVAAAALLDVLKDVLLPDTAPGWLRLVALLVGVVVGYVVDRVVGLWIDARWGAASSSVDTTRGVKEFFDPRSRGRMNAAQSGHWFQGRRVALKEINGWLTSGDASRLLVVTGDPGSGKSAILGRVITTSHPAWRRKLPRSDRGVRAPLHSIASEVHAKGATADDVAAEIGAELGEPGRTTAAQLPEILNQRLSGKRRRFVVVVDALDEADDPREVIRQVLRPMLDADPQLGIKLIVGTRRKDDRGSLPAALSSRRTEIDLDLDRYFDRRDVTANAIACLQVREDGPYQREHVARRLAETIADRAGRSFLVAGLMATHHGLHDTVPVLPGALTGGTSLAEVLDEFVGRLADVDGVPARDILVPLAYAQAPGLPIELWQELIRALTGKSVDETALTAFTRTAAANLLITSSSDSDGSDGETSADAGNPAVFRLFHQALNDTILDQRAEHGLTGPDQQAIAAALRAALPATGWANAPAYLARSLGAHLIAAGQVTEVEELLDGIDYLLHADLPRLHAALARINTPIANAYRHLIGTAPGAAGQEPRDRAGMFSVSALNSTPHVRERIRQHLKSLNFPLHALWGHLTESSGLQAVLTGHTGPVAAVAVTPDGTRAVTGSADDTVRMWDLTTGTELAVLTGHTSLVWAVAVTPDGTRAVTGSTDSTVRVWDLATGTELAVLTGHTSWVHAVAVTPDGTRAVTGSHDRTVRVWDLATGTELAVLTGHTSWVHAVAVTPDGTRVVTGSHDRTVRVWDLATGTELAVLTGHTDDVGAVAVTSDGTRAVTGSSDRTVRVWDLTTGTEHAVMTGHTDDVGAVAVTSDGTRAVTGSSDRTVRVWDLTTGTEHAVMTGHTSWVLAVAVTLDGARVVTGSGDDMVRVWGLATGTEHAVMTGHTSWVLAVAVTLDGARVVTGSGDRTVRVWDLATGLEAAVLTGHTDSVEAMAVALDGTRAVTGSGDRTVRVWDLATGLEAAVLTGHTQSVLAVAVTPDGARAITGSRDQTVRVWDLTTGNEHDVLTGHTGSVHAVAVTPDGTCAITGSDDGTVRVWDLATGTERAVLTGHTDRVQAVAVTPDGTGAITGSWDRTVRVWDLATGTELAVLTGHTGAVEAVAVTPDGTHAITGSYDHTVRVWDLTSGSSLATLNVLDPIHAIDVRGEIVVVGLSTGLIALRWSPPDGPPSGV